MQFTKNTSSGKTNIIAIIIKSIIGLVVILALVFFINKVDFPAPKKEIEKMILCDVQTEIYPDLEKVLLNLLHSSGYPNVKFEKKVDFEQLYNQRLN